MNTDSSLTETIVQTQPADRQNYKVTVRFQFPAWNEKEGISLVVEGTSKRDAIKQAKRHLEYCGTAGSGVKSGLQWWSAIQTDEPTDDLSADY